MNKQKKKIKIRQIKISDYNCAMKKVLFILLCSLMVSSIMGVDFPPPSGDGGHESANCYCPAAPIQNADDYICIDFVTFDQPTMDFGSRLAYIVYISTKEQEVYIENWKLNPSIRPGNLQNYITGYNSIRKTDPYTGNRVMPIPLFV